jgi:guanine nucleotide-binding protein subunit alpha
MSFASENTDAISLHFEFDSVVLCSIVYQTAFRSHLRQTIRLNRDADNLSTIAKIIAENATKDQRESPQLQADEAKSHLLTQASLASASDSSMSSYEITVDLDEVIEDDNRRQVSVANRPTATSISPKPSNKAQGLKGRMQALVINSLRQRIRHSSGRRRLSQSTVESGSLQNVVVTTTVDVDEVASAVSGTKSTIEESIKQRKVLMLGIGMSGKTTIFNSLLPLVSGEGDNSQAELSQWAPVIVKNVIENMKSILDIMGELDITFRNGTTSGCASMIVVAEATGRFEPLELAYAIKTVWADPGFKDAFQRHPRVTSEWDSLVNLVDDVDRLLQPGFVPTQQDVCKAWVRTTGIHQKVLRVRDVEISLYDVGGQRSERKKWIHCFDNVSVLMFVVDVTGYSKTMLEDNDNPGHDEQLMLFESIANSHWFTNSSMVLVMTKVDLLDDVLQRRPPTGKNFSALKPFTKERFLKHIENQFSCLMRNESKQKLLRVINADVIHSDTDAQKILELILEDLD